jgi:hypothetical protein
MWRASIPACSGDREFFRDPYLAGCGVSRVGVASSSRL